MFRGGTENGSLHIELSFLSNVCCRATESKATVGEIGGTFVWLFQDPWIKNKKGNVVFQAESKHVGGIRS